MELDAVCRDVIAWLPRIDELVDQPDTTTSSGHAKPSSKPPWNSNAANAKYDIHSSARRLTGYFRYMVTHTVRPRGGSDANTVQALTELPKLAAALPQPFGDEAAAILNRHLNAVMQLPAIDLMQPHKRIREVCPYCPPQFSREVWFDPLWGKVTCLRVGACFDGDGQHPKGELGHLTDGTPCIRWQDGLVT